MSEERKWKVYVHTNKVNGKKYVGLTSLSLDKRCQNGHGYRSCPYFGHAIRKYGWDSFSHEILEDGLTRREAGAWERYYISLFDTQNPEHGYNVDAGGGLPVQMTPEGRQRMIDAISGANAPRATPVVVFDLTGKRINEFGCVADAERFYGLSQLWNHVVSGRGTRGNLMFRLKSDFGDISQLPPDQIYKPFEQRLVRDGNSWHSTPIAVFDMNTGERVADFDYIKQSLSFIGTNPGSNLRGKSKSCNGYVCRYAKDVVGVDRLPPEELPSYKPGGKEVIQYDFSGNIIARYPSAREAGRVTGIKYSAISACVTHNSHSCGGFVWRLATDTSPFERPMTATEARVLNGTGRQFAVDQIDLKTGKVVNTFQSMTAAARAVGVDKSNISFVAKHPLGQYTAAGYGWRKHAN